MGMTRRILLVTGGAGVVVAGVGAWDISRVAQRAREPWRKAAQGFGDPRLDVLAYAILAPNPHNKQPWLIRLEEDDASFTVLCDTQKLLPETDPPSRQITIGFGCFLELLRMAAAGKGYRVEVTPFPEGEPFPALDNRPVAAVQLIQDNTVTRDPLFGEVLTRRTNRGAFDLERPVEGGLLEGLTASGMAGGRLGASNNAQLVERLRALTSAAWHTEWQTPRTRAESIEVTRIGRQEVNENPDGIALDGPLLEALHRAGILTQAKMDDPETFAYQQSLDFYDRACTTAMAYVWSVSEANTRVDQLEAGRVWIRTQMAANRAGLAFHPLSQALQEFPEMTPHYRKVHELLGASDGETVQMLVRLGYAKSRPRPAPRHSLTSRILSVS